MSDAFTHRSRPTHNSHVMSLNGPLRNHMSTTYGVTRSSCLNSSNYFHVTEGLIPDVMHDVLEGVAQYELKELIKHLVEDRIYTLAGINSVLGKFPYSYVDIKDKPTLISASTLSSSDHHLKQKG